MTGDPPTVLITGATDGLGRALAERLAADGTRVILHGRDPGRLATVADSIAANFPGSRPRTIVADLAELDQVRRMAERLREDTDRLEVLVNNAGVGFGEPDGVDRRVSADGHELRFAVNYLAGLLLTLELLPLLRRSAPARVVFVASVGQHPLDLDDLMLQHGYDGWRAYRQSKLAQIIAGFELASRLDPAQVTVNSLHPATLMPTKMVVQGLGRQVDSIADGVEATYRLVTDPALAGVTGRYFDRTREATAHEQAYDPQVRAELWRRSLELLGVTDDLQP